MPFILDRAPSEPEYPYQYDTEVFDRINKSFNFEITYLEPRLTAKTAALAHDHDAVCIFVNDEGSPEALEKLASLGVKYIALRVSLCSNHSSGLLQRLPPSVLVSTM